MSGSNEHDLVAYFRRMAAGRPPAPVPRSDPAPVRRLWRAAEADPHAPPPPILDRHPAFVALGTDIKPRVIGRSSRSVTRGRQGRLHSMKTNRTLRSRSELEYDHLLDAELDDDVTTFVEEPLTFRFPFEGRLALARPDAFLARPAGATLVEVKFEADASADEGRWPAIASAVNAMGLDYVVLTERHIRAKRRYATVHAIFERRQGDLPEPAALAHVLASAEAGTTIGRLVADRRFPIGLRTICLLARRGYLALDLDRDLDDGMPVRRGRGPHRMRGLVVGR